MLKKVLIANRGEIALRVIRACREMGVKSVAVYSEADRNALHVRWADQAFCIGPPPVKESYLNVERILEVAKQSGAEAIHPGYGFLAENGEFADACEAAELVFIGPSGEVMRCMGDKIEARRLMTDAGVPVMPGSGGEIATLDELRSEAEQIGFPIMIKATGGGGGKGIRIVDEPAGLESAFNMARSEAEKAFGNPVVYMERFLKNPHHIEFQVMADNHGNVIHLCERECSIQRRHQKIVEETPSPLVDKAMRKKMGDVAVRACKSIGYRNAGTVEFLAEDNKEFYFLEMNTRLQVEHPITEQITGLDLVKMQLKMAAGERLELAQKDVKTQGHAIEARIYAEDPDQGFLPSVGTVLNVDIPGGTRVRVDSGLYKGMEVSLFYDPMLAKLVVYDSSRPDAIRRLRRSLNEFHVSGVKTNIPFLLAIIETEAFQEGKYHTGYVEQNLEEILKRGGNERLDDVAVIAATLSHVARRNEAKEARRISRFQNSWVMSYRPQR
ncbi:MAG: acetyl-CoA carboxylase biotin carboxylase subunit [Planctomycetota bacterium]|jgi:acetyl-CoA carboxylase biotin carboxylase subunit